MSVSANGQVMYCSVNDEHSNTEVTIAIPLISLWPKEKEYPFEWSCQQFPVRVAFSLTINKAQGDSTKKLGIWLPNQYLDMDKSMWHHPEWVQRTAVHFSSRVVQESLIMLQEMLSTRRS